MQKKYRVIQWGSGYTGIHALRYVLDNPQLELVGLKCFSAEKEGRDAGEIAGLGVETGITATQDADQLLALDADCVLFMPRDALTDPSVPGNPSQAWLADLIAILESGKNVVSSIVTCTHWRHLANGEAFRERLNAACLKGNSTVFFTGFDPGFASDALAIALTSVVGNIRCIDTWEILDYSVWTVESTIRQMGLGVPPEEMNKDISQRFLACWGGAIHLFGDALGVQIDGIRIESEVYVSPHTFTTSGGVRIQEGTIGAFKFAVIGDVAGRPRFRINHVTRMDAAMAPHWPQVGEKGGYRVEIDAFAPLRCEFPMGLPGGTGTAFDDALAMTSARCVNAIEAVINARPGYLTFLDLSPLCGKYAFAQ